MTLSSALLCLCGLVSLPWHAAAFAHSPQAVNRKLLERRGQRNYSLSARFNIQESRPNGLVAGSNATEEFPEQWFTQPLDHFTEGSPTFKQRFWVNKRHYVPGTNGPVIVIDGGETSGEDRLPFLDTGIADILANATGGIGVVLEHRCVCSESFSGTFLSFLASLIFFFTATTVSWSPRSGVFEFPVLIPESRRVDTGRQLDDGFPSVNNLNSVNT